MTIDCTPGTFGELFMSRETARIQACNDGIEDAAVEATKIIRPTMPFDQGELVGKLRVEYHGLAPLETGDLCDVVDDAPHACAQEAGTVPFTPPLEPLQQWAVRKLGAEEGLAWGIARKIQQKIALNGMVAKWFFRDAMPECRAIVGEKIVEALKSQVKAERKAARQAAKKASA